MSRPIHSVKHIQASYQKYQWIALFSATLTIVAVILAALSSVHLGRLGKLQATAAKQNMIAYSSKGEELKKLKSQIVTLESQLSEKKSDNDQLDKKNKILQKKLNEVQQALSAMASEPVQQSAASLETIDQVPPKESKTSTIDSSQAEVPPPANRPKPNESSSSDGLNSSTVPSTTTNRSEVVDSKPVNTAASDINTPLAKESTASLPTASGQSTSMKQADFNSAITKKEKTPPSAVDDPEESSRIQ